MRKLFFCFVLAMHVAVAARADVVERTDCAAVKSQIAALTARDSLDDDDAAELERLHAVQRRDCMTRAGARSARAIAKTRAPSMIAPIEEKTKVEEVPPQENSAPVETEETSPAVAASCDAPDEHGCCPGEEFEDFGDDGKMCCRGDMCYPPMKTEAEKQAEKEAEIAANLAKGLCGDGTKPNKFGCCTGQKFKDMLDGTFACCPDDGGECVAPLTKGHAI